MSGLPKPLGVVYFVESPVTNAIKIGHTADMARRLSTLQIGSPTPLTVLLTVPGGRDVEAKLHQLFRREHIQGEWFAGSGELRSFVDHMLRISEVDRIQKLQDEPSMPDWVCYPETTRQAKIYLDNLKLELIEEVGAEFAGIIIARSERR